MVDGKLRTDLGTVNSVRSLLKPGSWLSKVDFINHLVLFNNILIAVLAEKEGGKTSFSSLLLSNLDQQIKPVFMTAKPPCTREYIVGDIAAQLHLNMDNDRQVSSVVAQINERKAHVLVIIDDSQHLPEQLIKEFLVALRLKEDSCYFHLCLISDYSVVATLNNFATSENTNLIHTIEIGSLNESETRTYVLQRAMANSLINKPLSEAQYKQFFQLTRGNIAKINTNLESFIFRYSKNKEFKKSKLIKTLVATACIAAATAFPYFFSSFYSSPKNSAEPVIITKSLTSAKHTIIEHQLIATNGLLPSYIPPLYEGATTQLVYNALPKKQILATSEDEPFPDAKALVDKVIVIPTVKKQLLVKENPIVKATLALDVPATQSHSVPKKEKIDVTTPSLPSSRILSASQKILPRSTASSVKPRKMSKPSGITQLSIKVSKAKRINHPAAASLKVKHPVGIKRKEMALSSSQTAKYTIQVSASRNKGDIFRLKQTNRVYSTAKVRHFTNQSGVWYVLTLGEYSTRALAQANANRLPNSQSNLKPWVRPISGLASLG